jgi:chromosome segregation ATPase
MSWFTDWFTDLFKIKNRSVTSATVNSSGAYTFAPEAVSDAIKEINRQINELKGHMNFENQTVQNDSGAINALYTQLRYLEQRLQELLRLLGRVQNTEAEYSKIKLKIEGIKNQISQCNNNLNASKGSISRAAQRIQQNINDYEILNKRYNDLVPTISVMDAQMAIDMMEINNLNGEISVLKDIIIKLNKIIEADKLVIEELNKNVALLDNNIEQLIIKIYSNIVYNNKNILQLNENIDSSLNTLFYHLNKDKKPSKVYFEQIKHRDTEHEILYNINKVIDILFYCFYFSFILIIICTQNMKREYFLIYLFVGLIPFIYPFLFKWLINLINYLFKDNSGPKNAFVDINNTVYEYNT